MDGAKHSASPPAAPADGHANDQSLMNSRRLMRAPLIPGIAPGRCRKCRVVHHSNFGGQCLSWVIFVAPEALRPCTSAALPKADVSSTPWPPTLCVIFVRSTRFRRSRHVRFAPIASEPSHRSESTRCATSGLMRCSKNDLTRSPPARASSMGGGTAPQAQSSAAPR
jgi:hypothetical protein